MADPIVIGRAGILHITIEQFTSLRIPLHFKEEDPSITPIDLSVYDDGFVLQVRENVKSDDPPLIELSSDDTTIEDVDLVNGDIALIFTVTVTSALDRNGVYDLVGKKSSGEVERLLKGSVKLDPGVTRPV